MPIYELALNGGVGTSGATQAEFRAPTRTAVIYEIGIFLTAATASNIGVGRPANTPAGGTLQLGQAIDTGSAAATCGAVPSGWSTAPTVPAAFFRRINLPNAIGNGIVWTWPQGLRVLPAASLVVWNLGTSSVASLYFTWME